MRKSSEIDAISDNKNQTLWQTSNRNDVSYESLIKKYQIKPLLLREVLLQIPEHTSLKQASVTESPSATQILLQNAVFTDI